MMNEEQAYIHWSQRMFEWATAAVEPSENATGFAQESIAKVVADNALSDMAETSYDGLLQAGYAPHEAAIAIARGAYLTIAEMIRSYGQEN